MVLVVVDGPDGALDVLHAHEALVQRQVVSHGILRTSSEHGLMIDIR